MKVQGLRSSEWFGGSGKRSIAAFPNKPTRLAGTGNGFFSSAPCHGGASGQASGKLNKARPLKYFGYLWTIFLLSILKTAKDRSMTSMTHLQPFRASIARWYFSDQRLGSLRRWEAWEACGPGSQSRVECPGAADCCPAKSNSNSFQNIQK